MKIAVATDDFETIPNKMLGRARFYAIYTWNENGVVRFVEKRPNPYEKTLQRGKTFDVLQVLSDCRVFISRHIGKRGIERIRNAGVDVFLTSEKSIEKAIQAYGLKIGGKVVKIQNAIPNS